MILMAIASMLLPMNEWQNSLLNMRFWNDNVKCVFVDCRQKISAGKSKQTSTFLDTRNSNKSSFEHLLTYLSLSINGLLEMWLQLLTFYFKILKYFLRQQPCSGRMTGDFAEAHSWVALLCKSCEHCSIWGWLPKVDQAPGYSKHGTIHLEIQLLLTTKEQNKNLELTANNSKRNKQTNIPAMKAVVRNILCTVIWVIGDRLKWV